MKTLKAVTGMSLAEAVRKLASRSKRVVGIYRFGSNNHKNLRSPFTDIDLAVVMWPYDEYVAADIALSLPPKFDVTILNEAPPFLIASALQHGKLLYCRNRRTLSTALMHITAHIRRHHDFLVRQGML